MKLIEVIENRHAVRNYRDVKIMQEVVAELNAVIDEENQKSGLNMQLITDDAKSFGGLMGKYGKFKNVKNYIALVGKNDKELDEKLGYYGEIIALKAQQLGLNTCWVAATYSKRKCKCKILHDEKLGCVIAVGYGETQGVPHKSKPIENFYKASEKIPKWFLDGIEAAILAPTALNQQKFLFILEADNKTVKAERTGGFYSEVDLGIVKCHFEIGASLDNFEWKK